jgi:hypothetical protein
VNFTSSRFSSIQKRWKLLGIALVGLIASASTVYAYWKITTPSSPTLYVTATSPPLELRMELDKTQFQLGETVIVRLFLKNIASQRVEVSFPHWAGGDDPPVRHVLNFVVRDMNDIIVYIRFTSFFLSIYEFILEAGEQKIETLRWTQIYNEEPYSGQSVGTGTYKIVGQTVKYDTWPRSALETPPISITIY